MTRSAPSGPAHRNDVLLVGELEEQPLERPVATGDTIVTFRLRVRPAADDAGGSDSLECSVRAPRVQRAALGWAPGDVVAAEGALRRRFYRAGSASRPFMVVEVSRARRLRASG
jgi:single-strand DNA-binding protein